MHKMFLLKDFLGILPDDMLCYIETEELVIYGNVNLIEENLPDEVLNGRVMKSRYENNIQYIGVSSAD